ncbi:hypothetical protein BCR37DRAFT_382429 [Protomyces lactucae-debilis]|uniref:Uncharacterized protein n=1 Tax=Protomyces lactucae-debilis TaxID=2754530 RepID=A0A1Y2F2S3_PROLT|nr:uncharacterized protein BCR37DRAFT_382429 [Protomyces lactucae-debilis]ORY78169.1 hypothetical protein BCR37DRAFT_382429 [Protomyces lactucae-debilis]
MPKTWLFGISVCILGILGGKTLPADNSNCQSLYIADWHLLHSVGAALGQICADGLLCQAPFAVKAYALTKLNFTYTKYIQTPDECQLLHGACAIHTNFTYGEQYSIGGCKCADMVFFPRMSTSPITIDGKTYQCDLKSIQARFAERKLPKPELYGSDLSCKYPSKTDLDTCVCNIVPGGIPSNANGSACSNMWNVWDTDRTPRRRLNVTEL